MARIPLFRRRPPGQPPEAPASEGEAPPPEQSPPAEAAAPQARRAPYNPGLLRRERRALVRAREERIRDLGGLILEMFRRDRFREDLMRDQAGEVFGLEARIQEIDELMTTTRQQVQAARCECGAPIVFGSHFCAHCGRPTGEAVVTCENCGHPLPADARFCGNCGALAPAATAGSPEPARPESSQPPVESAAPDPWER